MSIAREVKRSLTYCGNTVTVLWQAKDGVVGSVDLPYWSRYDFSMLEPIGLVARNSIIPLKLLASARGGN